MRVLLKTLSSSISIGALLLAFGFGGLSTIFVGTYLQSLNWPISLMSLLGSVLGPTAAIGGAVWIDTRKAAREREETRKICRAVLRSLKMEIDRNQDLLNSPEFSDQVALVEIRRFLSTCSQSIKHLQTVFSALARLDQTLLEMLIHFEYAATGNQRIFNEYPTGQTSGCKEILGSMLRTTKQPVDHVLKHL